MDYHVVPNVHHRRSSSSYGFAVVEDVDAAEMEEIAEDTSVCDELTATPKNYPKSATQYENVYEQVNILLRQKVQKKKRLVAGTEYYLVSCMWMDHLSKLLAAFAKEDVPRLTDAIRKGRGDAQWNPTHDFLLELDNSDLIARYTSWGVFLSEGIKEGEHYELVEGPVWQALMDIFGGGPEIARGAVEDPTGALEVDVVGITLLFTTSSDLTRYRSANFSHYDSVGFVVSEMCKRFMLDKEDVRLWDFRGGRPRVCLDRDETLLVDAGVADRRLLLLEERRADGTWDIDQPEITPANRRSMGSTADIPTPHEEQEKASPTSASSSSITATAGLVGLYNLRNTCYMNSTLQCLSSLPDLRDYFVSNEYKRDINEVNPLGTKGKLAKAFGKLMSQMWAKKTGRAISPQDFKRALEEFKPDFAGYMQHDAQELLSYLLDGLHEDLNRVKVKKMTKPVEPKGRPDHVVAQEAFEVYKLRNDSHVADLCTGMLLSKVVCPRAGCDNVSVTFDPYMILPLPVENEPAKNQTIRCTIVPWLNPLRQVVIEVDLPKVGPILLLRNAVAREGNLVISEFFLGSVSEHKIIRVLDDSSGLETLDMDTSVYAFENPKASEHLRMLHGDRTGWYRPHLSRSDNMIAVDENHLDYQSVHNPQQDDDYLDYIHVNEDAETGNTYVSFNFTAGGPLVEANNSKSELKLTCSYECPFIDGQIWKGCFEEPRGRSFIRLEVAKVLNCGASFKVFFLLDIDKPVPGSRDSVEQETRFLIGEYTPAEVARMYPANYSKSPRRNGNGSNPPTSPQQQKSNKRRSTSMFSPRNVTKALWSNFSVRRTKSNNKEAAANSAATLSSASDESSTGASSSSAEQKHHEVKVDPLAEDKLGEVDMDASGWKAVLNSFDEPTYIKRVKDFRCKGTVDARKQEFYGKVIWNDGFQSVTNDFFVRLRYTPGVDEDVEDSEEYQRMRPVERKLTVNDTRAVRFVNRLLDGAVSKVYGNKECCLDPGVLVVDKSITEAEMLRTLVERFTDIYNSALKFLKSSPGREDVVLGLPSSVTSDDVVGWCEIVRAGRNYVTNGVPGSNKEGVVGRVLSEDSDVVFFGTIQSFLRVAIYWDAKCPIVKLYEKVQLPERTSTDVSPMSIYDCFDLFCKEEKLSEMDSWYCSKCKVHTEATKTLQIWSFPRILILHLKRFSQEDMHYTHHKIDDTVVFPESLDVQSYALDPKSKEASVYDLCAVINHYGGLGSGHYTAFGRNEIDGKWYEFDDDAVSEVVGEIKQLGENAAYVLFYLRKDLRPKMWK